MNDAGWVHKKNASQNLVNKVLDVILTEVLTRIYDSMKVSLHEVCDDVDVIIVGFALWL